MAILKLNEHKKGWSNIRLLHDLHNRLTEFTNQLKDTNIIITTEYVINANITFQSFCKPLKEKHRIDIGIFYVKKILRYSRKFVYR